MQPTRYVCPFVVFAALFLWAVDSTEDRFNKGNTE